MAWPKPAKGTAGTSGAPEGTTGHTNEDAKARGVGATLREARERRGWAIADAAAYLRIRPAVLEAMEAGRFEKLPTGAYALGFVRTYAEFLGLDREEIIRRVKAEAAAVATRAELKLPQPIAESRLPSGVVLAVSALIAVAAYGVWYYQSATTTAALPRVEAVPERLAALIDKPPPSSSASQAEAATPNAAPATEAPATATPEVTTKPTEPAPAASEPNKPVASAPVASAPTVPPPSPAAEPPQVAAAVPPVVAPAPPAAPAQDAARPAPAAKQYGETEGARILFRATADSWVQVRDAAGTVVFSRILRPGDSYAAPNRAGYKLSTGNAGALEITVDGRKAPAIGRIGYTRKDVVLDPDRVLAGTAAPPEPVYPRPAVAPAPHNEAQPSRPSGG